MRASRRIATGLCAAALLLAPGAAALAADVRERLARMADAMRNSAYEGTFVHQRADNLQTLSLVHAVIDGVEHERLRTLSGEPFEVIREGTEVVCVWPRRSESLVARRPDELLPTTPAAALAELPAMYTAEIVGRERVAGREADVIAIAARDDQRYDYRLWIGREDHLLLRSDLVGLDGAILERILFTRLEPRDAIGSHRFRTGIDEAQYAEHYSADASDGEAGAFEWRATDLPDGFRAVSHRTRTMPDSGPTVHQSVYSDGLASVSVFVEPAGEGAGALQGLTYMGAVHAYGRRVGDRQVTVVGELPAATVRAIAESVRRAGAG